jgi:hypothetical protein
LKSVLQLSPDNGGNVVLPHVKTANVDSNTPDQHSNTSDDPEMNVTSSLLVNNFGLTDPQILANSGCANNVEPFLHWIPVAREV